jgi:hypothetical protein
MSHIKAELFDIEDKKRQQAKDEMAMKPIERLLLCLDLMDLARELSPDKTLHPRPDDIEWIELPMLKKDD